MWRCFLLCTQRAANAFLRYPLLSSMSSITCWCFHDFPCANLQQDKNLSSILVKLWDVVLSCRSSKVVCYLLSPLELLPAVSCAGQCQPKTAAGAIWVIAEISQWQWCLFISETLPWDNLAKLSEMGKLTVCSLCATSVPSLKSCLPSHQHWIEIVLCDLQSGQFPPKKDLRRTRQWGACWLTCHCSC